MPNLFSLDRRRVIATLNISKNITFQRSFFWIVKPLQEELSRKQGDSAIAALLRLASAAVRNACISASIYDLTPRDPALAGSAAQSSRNGDRLKALQSDRARCAAKSLAGLNTAR